MEAGRRPTPLPIHRSRPLVFGVVSTENRCRGASVAIISPAKASIELFLCIWYSLDWCGSNLLIGTLQVRLDCDCGCLWLAFDLVWSLGMKAVHEAVQRDMWRSGSNKSTPHPPPVNGDVSMLLGQTQA